MSMIFQLVAITPDQIVKLRETPSLARELATVAGNDAGELQRAQMLKDLPPERRQQSEARLLAMQESPYFIEAQKEVQQARQRLNEFGHVGPALDLEKSWHILHYLFTGDVGPIGSAGDALMAGDDVGEDFVGYGPPRLHSPASTRLFADFLQSRDLETFQRRANREAMITIGIYGLPMGQGAEAEFESGVRREIATYFPLLRNYVVDAATNGNGLLMWLT